MTSGYEPGDPGVHDPTAPRQDPSDTGRLGPRPPRMGPAMGPPSGQFPTVGGYRPPAPPPSGPPLSGPPVVARPMTPPPPRRGGRLGVVAFVLVLILLVVAVLQTAQIVRLNQRLDAAQRGNAAANHGTDARLHGLESRTGDLEKHSIDPQAVAHDSLPSVFRVSAGADIGTAFAVGKEPADGTDLVTNFHVVEALYKGGGRDVSLQHQDQLFHAKITKVDPFSDLALLHASEKFPRLTAATAAAQPGQPVVVVGAPLGLESSVTSGVISALRTEPNGQPALQFDAAINPGNSGGPVINAQRQVVGIATSQIQGAAGLGFAIPISVACQSLGVC